MCVHGDNRLHIGTGYILDYVSIYNFCKFCTLLVQFSQLPARAACVLSWSTVDIYTHNHQSQVVGILWSRRGGRRQRGGREENREGEGGGRKQEGGGGGGDAGRGRERVECRTGYVHVGHNNYGEGEESTRCLCRAKLHREGTHNSQYQLVIRVNYQTTPHLQAAAEDIVCREPSRHSPCRCWGEL